MTMKRPLFYTLMERYNQFEVLAVTLEKRGVYYGRTLPGNDQTHVRISECIGRFDDEFQTHSKIEGIALIRKKHNRPIENAARELARLKHEEQIEINNFIRGLE